MYYGQNPNGYGVVPYNASNGMYVPQQTQYGNLYGQVQQIQPISPQTAQMPYQQPQQASYGVPIRDIRFVTSEEAKAFIVMPNSNVLLIDTASGKAFLKSADSIGQSVTKTYKFEELNVDGGPVKSEEKKSDVDMSAYVKRDDIAAYIEQQGFVTHEQYKSLQDQVNSLKRELTAKNDKSIGNDGEQ